MTATTGSDTVQHAIGPTGELEVRVHTGELELRGVDGDTVRVRDLDGNDLGERLVVEATEGRLRIRPRERFMVDFGFALGGFGRSVNLAIEVPAAATIGVDTASADVSVSGTRGVQRLRTASGTLQLADVAGDIQVDAVSGEISVRVAGDARIKGRAVSGDVTIRAGSLQSLVFATTSGDIDIDSRLVGEGPFAVETVSGDVEVVTNAGLAVTAKTVTGDITADGARRAEGRGQHFVTIGDGRTPFTFKSISGDLDITRESSADRDATMTDATAGRDDDERAAETEVIDSEHRSSERLEILRELEAGTIDIDTASKRLAELEGDA